ncbi:butyrophilin subfamily 2 member A2-like [Xiphophorus hellerii]|uniref:butyrophilin subfamily 2 member A2-like n=1 Tax=Xiphophorus hellerii TaxID=8084 RepID=UPI0013B3D8A4|nr:butyrophilin subfamily 2 member A2-like [Xiphophorus hellerii]
MTAAALLLLLMPLLLCSADADKITIAAKTGDNVSLPCDASNFKPIKTVEWSRPDEENKYVIFCPNQNSDPVITEDQYKNRVELLNRTNGNVTIVLHNVGTNDSGIYECYVQGGGGRTKRAVRLISTVSLDVAPPAPQGNMDGNRGEGGNEDGGNKDGLGVSRSHVVLMVAVAAVAAVIVSMVIVIRRKKIKTPSSFLPEDAQNPQLI